MNKKRKKRTKTMSAFTLMEIIVVIGLFVVIVGIVFPMSLRQISQNELSSTTQVLTSDIFTQQQKAHAGENDQSYGINFSGGSYEIYTGDSYVGATEKETMDIPSEFSITSISFSDSNNDLNFSKGEFFPDAAGFVRISDSTDTYDVVINSEGAIYYEKV